MKGEFGCEEVIITDDKQSSVREEGYALPLLGELFPGKPMGGEVKRLEIEQEGGFDVLDLLLGVEFLEFWVGGANRVGFVGKGEEVGGVGKIQSENLFEDGTFGI